MKITPPPIIKINCKTPGICISYSNKASIYGEKSNLDTALDLYKKALEITPNKEEYHHKLDTLLKKRGELKEAINYFTSALENSRNGMLATAGFPHLTDSYLKRGIALKYERKIEKALPNFNRASINDIANPLPYKYRAKIHDKLGNTKKAKQNLNTYNSLTSDSK